jgi:hypothetical protein
MFAPHLTVDKAFDRLVRFLPTTKNGFYNKEETAWLRCDIYWVGC